MPTTLPIWSESESLDSYSQRLQEEILADRDAGFQAGCDLLEAFLKENFVGPPHPVEYIVCAIGVPLSAAAHQICVKQLALDGESAFIAVRHPILLIAAECSFEALNKQKSEGRLALWLLRTYMAHELIMHNKTSTLKLKLDRCIAFLLEQPPSDVGVSYSQIRLEIGYVHHYYRLVDQASRMFLEAKRTCGLTTQVTGMLGVRTEHQSFKVAQLVVHATSSSSVEPFTPKPAGAQHKIIQSEDCNVLQRPCHRNIVFKEEDDSPEAASNNISIFDQAVLLSLCLNVQNNNPHHGLTGHEMLAYVERVLMCTNTPYTLTGVGVTLKAKLEWERTRVQERALLQLQELADVYNVEGGNREARFPYFFLVPFSSFIVTLKDLAARYLSLNMNKTAESVAEQIQDWQLVVTCCLKQGNVKRAEKVVRDLLDKRADDPLLWCALGEATTTKEHFLTAWEKSGQKCAEAMRGLAKLCTDKEQWEESISYFDRALALNPMFGANWFTLGHACMKTGNWARSAEAFTRVVQLDAEDGMAWSNLASSFLQLNSKKQALRCMTEAMKLMEYSWKVKENHFRIAADLGEWQTAMNDLLSLLEMKGHSYKMVVEDLRLVVHGLVEEIQTGRHTEKDEAVPANTDGDGGADELCPFGIDSSALFEELREGAELAPEMAAVISPALPGTALKPIELRGRVDAFVDRLVGTYTDQSDIYDVCAEYHCKMGEPKRAFELYLKEERSIKLKDWTKVADDFREVVKVSEKQAKLALQLDDLQVLSQSDRMLRNTIKGATEYFRKYKELEMVMDLQQQVEAKQSSLLQ
eukprot:NODE_70_length_2646_cov_243.969580_g54_i0.p1 GENE.NODE_70_length_2646_cov_243.969580_g54_i0~~NODE_70_length_2646_cov_243.969580_g54_i0.p1  ORF type:complete len:831 (-),score=201.85 NODE_70_length_2646_cov_243.969580_g54_i0:152-2581(-)